MAFVMTIVGAAQWQRARWLLASEGAALGDSAACAGYDVTPEGGIVVGRALKGYDGLLSGTPSTTAKGRR